MIYFKIITIVVTAIGLLIYTLIFDRKYFFPLMVIEVICAGFLSFYTFYYIGSYNSSSNDVQLYTNILNKGSGQYLLKIDIKWRQKPEIFGFDGNSDLLIVRYNPQLFELTGADKEFKESELGKKIITLSNEFNYSKISKNEKEIGFNIKDGQNATTNIDIKKIKPGGVVKVFFLHDYKIPLGSPVYWEKDEIVEFNQ